MRRHVETGLGGSMAVATAMPSDLSSWYKDVRPRNAPWIACRASRLCSGILAARPGSPCTHRCLPHELNGEPQSINRPNLHVVARESIRSPADAGDRRLLVVLTVAIFAGLAIWSYWVFSKAYFENRGAKNDAPPHISPQRRP